MSFTSESGYLPITIAQMMTSVRENVNTQFNTDYDETTFLGTNFYKYFYALIQRLQENEVKTSEIFLRMQEYFNITNEKILRPNTTHPGIFDYFDSKGYFVSTKPPENTDAGKVFICVDVTDNHARGLVTITSFANLVSGADDSIEVAGVVFVAQAGAAVLGAATFQAATSDEATAISLAAQINAHATASAEVEAVAVDDKVYIRALELGTAGNALTLVYDENDAAVGATVSGSGTLEGGAELADDEEDYDDVRAAIAVIIRDCVVAGVVSQGSEIEELTLTNGQEFEFKYNLPNKIPVLLRLTITQSENNEFTSDSPDDIKQALFDNIEARYKLGKNFEPQRYYSVVDAPWASQILLEWSTDDGDNWSDEIYDADYDEVFDFELTDIEVVEE